MLQRTYVIVIVIAFRPLPSTVVEKLAITIDREKLIPYHRHTAVHWDIGGGGDGIGPSGDICHSFTFLNVARSSVL